MFLSYKTKYFNETCKWNKQIPNVRKKLRLFIQNIRPVSFPHCKLPQKSVANQCFEVSYNQRL